MSISRRSFIGLSFGGIATAICPSNVYSGAQLSYEKILDSVHKISGGKPHTLKILYPQGSLANLKPIAGLFTEKTQVQIEFVETTVDGINTKMYIDSAGNQNSYDIALPATFGIPGLADAEVIADQTSYSQRYETEFAYNKSLYSLGDYYKGRFYGYQTDGDAYLMFYSKKCMEDSEYKKRFSDKYGQELSLPKSWKELDQLMQFFHKPEDNKYGGCLFRTPSYMVWEWWIRFHAKGYYPVGDDMKPNINNDAGVEALEDLFKATKFQHPSVKTNGLFDNWKEYAKGECVVNIGWGGSQKHFNSDKSRMKGKMLFAPTPQVSYFNWGWNYVTSNLSRQKELAYLFCLFATTPEVSILGVRESGFFDPFREEHYSDRVITSSYSKPFLSAHREAMRTAIPDFYIKSYDKYMSALKENISLAAQGDIAPKEALSLSALQWEKITDEEGRAGQVKQWAFLKKQYPDHLKLQ